MARTSFRFSNVVLEREPRCAQHPLLYCRSDVPFVFDEGEGAWLLPGPGAFDFTTYFNALPVRKLREVTAARGFSLHLELKGAACSVRLTSIDRFGRLGPLGAAPRELAALDGWRALDMPVEPRDGDVLAGFAIDAEGPVWIRESSYALEMDEEALRPVELAVAMTTFKKEPYVLKNVEKVRWEILGGGSELAGHFHLHVVDNGRTLDAAALSGPGVSVHPNPNVGGSGGFARGMLEALEQDPPATNVLLMDDDVEVSCESLYRTYALLRCLRPEKAGCFVGGAMMDLLQADEQVEDLGYMGPDGRCHQVKPRRSMEQPESLALAELCDPAQVSGQVYQAWWYCCIPATAIREHGLPLPLFIRYDDVEYSLRCRPGFITMVGLCVWHMPFLVRYNATVECFHTTRNAFVLKAAGRTPGSDYVRKLRRDVDRELKRFSYEDAGVVLDGFEAFLSGPESVEGPDGEEVMAFEKARGERLVPLGELREGLDEAGRRALDGADAFTLAHDPGRSLADRLRFFLTRNGSRLGFLAPRVAEPGTVSSNGWEFPAGRLNRREELVVIDPHAGTGATRRLDPERYREVARRLRQDMRAYRRRKSELGREWREAASRMSTPAFWRAYLGLVEPDKENGPSVGDEPR